MKIGALITAAGAGTRLGVRKQFLDLAPSERLVDRAVATTREVADWVGVILPEDHPWDGPAVDACCAGGGSRYDSIAAGLALVPSSIEVIIIHSASHPLASPDLARTLVDAIKAGADGAVPFLEAVDVIKRQVDGRLVTVGREGYGAAQCPMAFSRAMLDRAFAETSDGIEESQLVESIGGTVLAVPGEVSNIHVTDQASLDMARNLAAFSR